MTTTSLAYSTSTDGSRQVRNDLLKSDLFGQTIPDYDYLYGDDDSCLGSQGVISTSSCNIISARSHGHWCPSCHPGDDVSVEAYLRGDLH